MRRKLVIFELNEVPYKVIDDHVAAHPHSHFATLLRTAAQFVGKTPDQIHLHPKVSWPTFHRGVPDTVHGILEYNQDTTEIDRRYPRFWEVLRAAGRTIGIGGSIGSYPVPRDDRHIAFYLPDLFAPTFETKPHHLSAFQAFNNGAIAQSQLVVRRGLDKQRAATFLLAAPRLGIRGRTLLAAVGQLASEVLDKRRVVRRRTIQAILSFDVVYRQLKTTRPDLVTFFSNHCASSMHRYWAATYPHDYAAQAHAEASQGKRMTVETSRNEMSRDWIDAYKGEIPHTMRAADKMLGDLMAFVARHPEYRLLLITTMGQRAAVAKPVYNQLVLAEPGRFFSRLGLEPGEWRQLPGMEPCYNVAFSDAAAKARFIQRARGLQLVGTPFAFETHDERSVTFWVDRQNVDPATARVELDGASYSLSDFGLQAEAIQDEVGSSGWHIPEGTALVFDPQADLSRFGQRREVPTTAFTSAILASFGLEKPDYMPAYPEALAECFGLVSMNIARPMGRSRDGL
ncbi:hypothetical protein J7643_19890 [bacterium]|nr:hypothetical protein [bacterium]